MTEGLSEPTLAHIARPKPQRSLTIAGIGPAKNGGTKNDGDPPQHGSVAVVGYSV
ncbi:hypothetical protein [Arthrobacter bambusae]|uniref:hypothetical protein n=1 Tax=Arthrobacter bambusae TaxID=1338426 RepID=UPI0027871638|nr:hypothetical protein [Arthrobacter bambusae]MDQ0030038.1 hypothetical protein [Arthrobacter bambusae]MDQ0097443.1 hypothetical protein [Arthrobacter bambusae]